MGQWVVTVAGIAILSVLCDIILPEGQTRKYVKTVFGIVVTLVIIQPIVGLFRDETVFPTISGSEMELQQAYIDSVNDRELQIAIDSALTTLSANGIDAEINISDDAVTVLVKTAWKQGLEQDIYRMITPFFPERTITVVWV